MKNQNVRLCSPQQTLVVGKTFYNFVASTNILKECEKYFTDVSLEGDHSPNNLKEQPSFAICEVLGNVANRVLS